MENPSAFEKFLQEAVLWIRSNQERFWAITGGSLLFIMLILLMIHHRDTENNDAWLQLGNIQSQMMQGKLAEARKALDTWNDRFRTTDAGSYAKFMNADLLFRTSDYVQASQIYADLAQTAHPEVLKPLALSAQVSCEETAGHAAEALKLAQTFLDKYPDHFLAAPDYMQQARLLELTGNSAGAAAVYDRFVLLYPQSPWTALARSRSQTLGGHTQAPIPGSVALPPLTSK